MSLSFANEIRQRLLSVVREQYGLEMTDAAMEVPPKTELGDLAFPVAFELAKRIKAATGEKKNPREIAASLAKGLSAVPGIARAEVAGAGYLNLFFDRARIFSQLVTETPETEARALDSKLIVEHTSINPNKAAHIGHVRNAVLGDTTTRILKAVGEKVEIHNYIDNTGVQVADVVVGFLDMERKTRDEVQAIAERPATRREESFDYYCWDLYSRVGQWYEADKSRLELRARTLHEIEAGGNPTADLGEYISSKIVDCHLDTMSRLDISYDLLARESEILRLRFWAQAFENLKNTGVIVLETEGRNKGCWVMRAEDGGEAPSAEGSEHDADKIIVRSNGTVTYTGKDIAYHLWKLGKLGLDFYYRKLRADHRGNQVWITTSEAGDAAATRPLFGNGTAFLNVIDVGQSYPQASVKRGVMAIDHDERVARSAHLAYEKVTLSADSARELGVEAEGAVSMSGRKGLGVKADDLIDRLEANALTEVRTRHPELAEAGQQRIAHQIAVAALRYFLLKYTRTSIIAFDFKEALSFEGETGPYIQYSAVRANNIFRKLGRTPDEVRDDFGVYAPESLAALFSGEAGNGIWSLVYFAGRLEEVMQVSAASFEPAHVARYAFQLAKQFNNFYHDHHILSEPDEARRGLLLVVADLARRRIEQALALLGIETPEKM
ncbi:MAG: arginine--tRNA ligase [Blastocatellia bacterium]